MSLTVTNFPHLAAAYAGFLGSLAGISATILTIVVVVPKLGDASNATRRTLATSLAISTMLCLIAYTMMAETSAITFEATPSVPALSLRFGPNQYQIQAIVSPADPKAAYNEYRPNHGSQFYSDNTYPSYGGCRQFLLATSPVYSASILFLLSLTLLISAVDGVEGTCLVWIMRLCFLLIAIPALAYVEVAIRDSGTNINPSEAPPQTDEIYLLSNVV